ncbi:MAG: single-stranded DNA-binding protein [Phycisphaerales bacterium]|nr:single-stranded DNA-binding protein [Phycisphaerales bacterium]MCB9858049.1 single-stranded DNA-binding protein [Phycisphaerales bacterium]MCB9864146.1 single-stranded DNA-binding protein [Phycisphaerales bacterium]
MIDIHRDLSARLSDLRFGAPVTHVYNPMEYAGPMMNAYLERYAHGPKRILLLGMNPGPWGMAQSGVPFGEVSVVREWLKLSAPIGTPEKEHAKRPVLGLACPRSEVSGARLWGWARDRYRSPGAFFKTFFVANYCPLCFLEATGRNRTPDQLPAIEAGPLYAACDDALRSIVSVLKPKFAVGVGVFAERRLRAVLGDSGPRIGRILHPSPASPKANRGWADAATAELRAMGIEIPGD